MYAAYEVYPRRDERWDCTVLGKITKVNSNVYFRDESSELTKHSRAPGIRIYRRFYATEKTCTVHLPRRVVQFREITPRRTVSLIFTDSNSNWRCKVRQLTCLLIVVARRLDMICSDSSDEIVWGIKFLRALIREDAHVNTRYHYQMCRFRTLRPDIVTTKMFINKFKSFFQNFNKDEHTFLILSNIWK